jgi:hypothetical protein
MDSTVRLASHNFSLLTTCGLHVSIPFLLAQDGLACSAQLDLQKDVLHQYGPSFKQLTLQVTPETPSRLHVKVSPTGMKRWEVPASIVQR